MHIQWKRLILCLAIPLAVGGLSAWLTRQGMDAFQALVSKPPLTPPGWVFPVVWTILFLLMGLASYRVLISGKPQEQIQSAWQVYGLQLLFNFLWSILFFQLAWYLFAFLWLLCLLALIAVTLRRFYRIDRVSGYLLLPYLLWVTFAGYLNLGIYWLN